MVRGEPGKKGTTCSTRRRRMPQWPRRYRAPTHEQHRTNTWQPIAAARDIGDHLAAACGKSWSIAAS